MRKRGYIAGVFLMLWIFLFPGSVLAEESRVADLAEVFTEQEEAALQGKMEDLENHWKQTFVIVSTRDAQGKNSREYADDYYDDHGFGENGVLFLLDLDNGEIWISTSGSMIRFLTDERIEKVLDTGYGQLQQGQYAEGMNRMLDAVEGYLEAGIPGNQYTYDALTGEVSRHYRITWLDALLAAAAGLAIGGIVFGVVCARYRGHAGDPGYPFRLKGKLTLKQEEDHLVNCLVTHRRIPKSTSSGGGGRSTIHTSSSGRSHGGGGRRL